MKYDTIEKRREQIENILKILDEIAGEMEQAKNESERNEYLAIWDAFCYMSLVYDGYLLDEFRSV